MLYITIVALSVFSQVKLGMNKFLLVDKTRLTKEFKAFSTYWDEPRFFIVNQFTPICQRRI